MNRSVSCLLACLAVSTAWADDAPSAAEILLHDARARARHGDHEGTRLLAERALQIEGDHQRTAQYLIARAWELQGEPERALAIYEALIAAWPRRRAPDDLVFRYAACLGALERRTEARRTLRWLGSVSRRPELDQLKIELLRGTWELQGGRARRGLRRLTKTLEGADPQLAPSYQADARLAILTEALRSAGAQQTRSEDDLRQRAELLEIGNVQLAALVRLSTPEPTLEGFLRMGLAHEALGDDLLTESPYPGGLTLERVEGIWTKATLFYDRALSYAAMSSWASDPVPGIRAELQALIERVDTLPEP